MASTDKRLDALFETLKQAQAQKQLPPVHLWNPEHKGEIDIFIDAQGQWFHEGVHIRRQPLVDLFATILRRDTDDYYLVTPAEQLRISVADVPFMGIDLDIRGTGAACELLVTTNVGDHVVISADSPLAVRGGKPYVLVRGGLEALLTRSVYYRLVDVAVTEGDTACVYSGGARFELGAI